MFKQLNPILPVKEILKEINGLADEMAGLSNLELKNKTQEFKERLAQGESLDDLLPEAFAVVREADKRVLGMFLMMSRSWVELLFIREMLLR